MPLYAKISGGRELGKLDLITCHQNIIQDIYCDNFLSEVIWNIFLLDSSFFEVEGAPLFNICNCR